MNKTGCGYRGTSLIRNRPTIGSYGRTIPRILWWSYRGRPFLMNKIPLESRRMGGKRRRTMTGPWSLALSFEQE